MAKKQLIIEFSEYDLNQVVADLEGIRRFNPQRYEMEQLTAICYESRETCTCVGYKDLTADEFWARGHMPGHEIFSMPVPVLPNTLLQTIPRDASAFRNSRPHFSVFSQ